MMGINGHVTGAWGRSDGRNGSNTRTGALDLRSCDAFLWLCMIAALLMTKDMCYARDLAQ